METHSCQNCKNEFLIRPEDILFYEKIKVPKPTFCPECRLARRLMWRNNRSLYPRTCGLCNKNLISMYKDDGTLVYCETCYAGDTWDIYQHAQEIDFSIPFLIQFQKLFFLQPRVYSVRYGVNINSDYANSLVSSKDMYLAFSCIESEKVLYSENVDRSRNVFDSLSSAELEQCSWNNNANKNYNSHYLIDSENCVDSLFLYDCTNCSNCFMSSNLRNQSYYFKNQKLDKETYQEKMKEVVLSKYSNLVFLKKDFQQMIKESIHRFALVLGSQNATGDLIYNSHDIYKSFDIRNGENISYSYRMIQAKDCMDCGWIMKGEFEYETMTGSGGCFNQVVCFMCIGSRDIQYSVSCRNCVDCFGCVGLTNAKYCILNKQYTKEEYFDLLPKIKEHMMSMPYVDKKGRVFTYGEFFPYELSLFGYNESLAHDFFRILKEEAIEKGYKWYERSAREYITTQTSDTLPDDITDVGNTILEDIIACPNNGDYKTQCTKAFKIHPEELQFLKQKGLPLPRYCPNCRHYERLSYKNPLTLYTRSAVIIVVQNFNQHMHQTGQKKSFVKIAINKHYFNNYGKLY